MQHWHGFVWVTSGISGPGPFRRGNLRGGSQGAMEGCYQRKRPRRKPRPLVLDDYGFVQAICCHVSQTVGYELYTLPQRF